MTEILFTQKQNNMESTAVKIEKGKRYTVTKDDITIRFYPVTIDREKDECDIVVYHPYNGHVIVKPSKLEAANPTLIPEYIPKQNASQPTEPPKGE